jgi:hypothetical protein
MSKSTRKDTARWMDWYWNKGGREKCLARRSTKEYRIKEKANESDKLQKQN